MFGQQKSGFGTSSFGSTGGGGLFGNKTNTTGGSLFGNTGGTTGFGSTGNTGKGGFGSFGGTTTGGIFGTPASKTGGSLFGTPTQGFGTSTQSNFGGSSFGGTQTGGLFGSKAPASTAASSFGGGLFGAAGSFGNQTTGTGGAKFAPVTGNDTMMKNGLQQSISTKHQCITAMKNYEAKSFEELRVEDYQSGRKGPAAGSSAFGSTPSTKPTGFAFGQPSTGGGMFGSSTAKPTFGGGAGGGGLFGNNTNTSASGGGGMFGGSKPFGTATATTGGFNFGGTSTGGSLFGSTAKPAAGAFGGTSTTASGGLFGNTGGSSFGGNTAFGGNTGVFGKSSGGFGTGTQPSTGFGNTGTNLFGSTAKPAGSLFGASSGFGQPNAGGSLFGGTKPAFGATNASTGGGIFGNTLTNPAQNKGLLGGGFATGTNLGAGTGVGGFGTGTLFGQQPAAGTANQGALTLPSASNQQSTEMLQALLTKPFGDSPLFKNDLSDPAKRQELLKPTNQAAQQVAIQSPVYRVSSGAKSKIKPKAHSNMSPHVASSHGKPHQLFAGLEPEEDAAISNRSFVGRSSVKRLAIKVTPNTISYPGTPRDSASPSSPRDSVESETVGKRPPSASEDANGFKPQALSEQLTQSSLSESIGELPARSSLDQGGRKKLGSTDSSISDPSRSRSSRPASIRESSPDFAPASKPSDAFTARPKDSSRSVQSTASGREAPDQLRRGPPTLFNDTMSDLNVHMKKASSVDFKPFGKSDSVDPEGYDDGDELLETENEPHPAGIVLRRSGYYTLPNLDELATMVDENGRCKIADFTVGRLNYGSVFFPGEVDVTNLNLDEIVHIRRKEVTLYPDDSTKPPVGEGLNRPAEVTLDRVWPTDKATREPVSDPERLSHMKWAQKLEQTTAKMGARFLDYRPETGSWNFEVNHFSKYGLPESDDEVEVEQPKATTEVKKVVVPKKTTLWSARAEADRVREPSKRHVGLGGEAIYVGDVVSEQAVVLGNEEEEMSDAGNELRDPLPSADEFHSLSQKMALGMGVKANRLQSMKESFFADEEEPQGDFAPVDRVNATNMMPVDVGIDAKSSERALNGILFESSPLNAPSPILSTEKRPRNPKTKRLKKTTFVEAVSKPMPAFFKSNQESSPLPPHQQVVQESLVQLQKPKLPVVAAPKRSMNLLPYMHSNRESLLCDSGQLMGRSFRVGWGPGWMLVHGATPVSLESVDAQPDTDSDRSRFSIFSTERQQDNSKFNVHVEIVKSAPHLVSARQDEPTDDMSDLPYLDIAWRHSKAVDGQEKRDCSADRRSKHSASERRKVELASYVPFLEPSAGVEAMEEYAEAAQRAWESVDINHPDSGFTLACRTVFGLCDTLWGKSHVDVELAKESGMYTEQMRRKRMLVSWLIEAIGADAVVGRKRKTSEQLAIDEVFEHVADGQVDKAVQCALNTGNGRLACLLASACSSSTNSLAVAKQLVEWVEMDADTFVSETTLKLYCLLAAKPTWLTRKGSINTCAGLDWKRSLLFHLTYLSDSVAPLSDGLQSYRTAWKGDSEFGVYSAAPLPPYIERSREILNDNEKEEVPVRDICYHLMKLYSKRSHRLDTTLCPSTSVPHPLDHRLSWHVWRLLYSAGYRTNMRKNALAALHTSYAAQLESRGLWHRACFVLMHIYSDRKRELAVRNLLGRYVTSDRKDEEEFVFEELGVPVSWLHECRALHAKSSRNHHQVALNLLKSGHWQSGHDALMKDVVADSLIHDRFSYLADLLTMIEEGDASASIKDWDVAGKVYLDHIKLNERINQLREEVTSPDEIEREFESLWPEVTSLCQRVADLKCVNAKDRLARADMAKRTLNLYNVMHSILKRHELTSAAHRPIARFVPSDVLAANTIRMHLPEDYAVQDLSKIVENHFIELVSLRKQLE